MTARLGAAVELLERALSYTRVQLCTVHDGVLDQETPCAGWRLRDLLVHMEDSLDAFTEAAGGSVLASPPAYGAGRVLVIQQKACALLGAWGGTRPGDVRVGGAEGLDLPSPLLVATAALEVTVHGWDVAQATGARTPLPDDLAADLLPVAAVAVLDHDRGLLFGPPLPVPADAPAGERLLAHLGRT